MDILVVGNKKGGVAKSTTAGHLGFFAVEIGLRTLVVDLDEGSVTSIFPEAKEGDKPLLASMLFSDKDSGRKPRNVAPNLDLIENDTALHDIDGLDLNHLFAIDDELQKPDAKVSIPTIRKSFNELVAPLDRGLVGRSLARFAKDYDLCIIDTPPNPSNRLLGALMAADAVLVPMDLDKFTIDRIESFKRTVQGVMKDKSQLGKRLRMLGYLPSKVNPQSAKHMQHLIEVREQYGHDVFDSTVAVRSSIPAALSNGHPVWTKARSGAQREAAKEMRKACAEVFHRLQQIKG
ncbi:ParA family protein [Pandoraea cepalis]|uniref:ParA family protein n=1 Tax=Pandoraea cepalis TaxID=2508294 RepID=A0AAW7MGY1_9BURK|nr:ParA family protein [Pandoraea cepalis]MDN4571992.1 ParA family protein [Pandoraea cepalis]MDN4576643.1 ParA family protein [Pandoraea cepalis]